MFFAGFAVGVVEHQIVAALIRDILDAALKSRIKRIGNVGDNAGQGDVLRVLRLRAARCGT